MESIRKRGSVSGPPTFQEGGQGFTFLGSGASPRIFIIIRESWFGKSEIVFKSVDCTPNKRTETQVTHSDALDSSY